MLSTLKVEIPVVKEILSLSMGLWYLIYTRRGENKVQAFRRAQTIASLKATWEKGEHPLLKLFTDVQLPKMQFRGWFN